MNVCFDVWVRNRKKKFAAKKMILKLEHRLNRFIWKRKKMFQRNKIFRVFEKNNKMGKTKNKKILWLFFRLFFSNKKGFKKTNLALVCNCCHRCNSALVVLVLFLKERKKERNENNKCLYRKMKLTRDISMYPDIPQEVLI